MCACRRYGTREKSRKIRPTREGGRGRSGEDSPIIVVYRTTRAALSSSLSPAVVIGDRVERAMTERRPLRRTLLFLFFDISRVARENSNIFIRCFEEGGGGERKEGSHRRTFAEDENVRSYDVLRRFSSAFFSYFPCVSRACLCTMQREKEGEGRGKGGERIIRRSVFRQLDTT